MRFLVIAVGHRMPDWVDTAVEEYVRRMPRTLRTELKEVRPEARTAGRTAEQCMAAEAERIEAALPRDCQRVVLDEHGRPCTTVALARMVERWQAESRDIAFLIGGADGLDPRLKAAAHATMRLSDLTLPHGLARVLLVEQLYRAVTILAGHPYHRE